MTPCVFQAIFFSGLAIGAIPDVASLENDVLSQRRKIVSGHIKLNSKMHSGNKVLTYVRMTEIWFDDNGIRSDILTPQSPGPSFGGAKRKTVTVFSKGKHIKWIYDSEDGAWSASVTTETMKSADKIDRVIDPRVLGMVPSTSANLIYTNLETIVARPDRTIPTLKPGELNGQECWQVRYELSQDRSILVCYSPGDGNNVVYIESVAKFPTSKGNVSIKDSVASRFEKPLHNAPWFPKECKYERYIDSKLEEEETLEIELCELNIGIDPSIYTIEGIGLKPGTYVYDRSSQGNAKPKVWNGQGLLAEGEWIANSLSEARLRWRYVVLGLILFVAAVYLFANYLRRRKNAKG